MNHFDTTKYRGIVKTNKLLHIINETTAYFLVTLKTYVFLIDCRHIYNKLNNI